MIQAVPGLTHGTIQQLNGTIKFKVKQKHDFLVFITCSMQITTVAQGLQ